MLIANDATNWAWDALVSYGPVLMSWALTGAAAVGTWVLARLGASKAHREAFVTLGGHARDVILEVWQVYVEGIKAGRADGELTPIERMTARDMAIQRLRLRLNWRQLIVLGGGWLSRFFGGASWAAKLELILGGAVETAVAESKRSAKAAGLTTAGKAMPITIPITVLPSSTIPESPIPPEETKAGPPSSPR
jgi:hypothetical protein